MSASVHHPRGLTRRVWSPAAVIVLVLAAVQVPAPVSAVPVNHFTANAATEALLPRHVQPAAIMYEDRVCIAFQGTGYDPMLVTYEPDSGEWVGPVRIGVNPLVLDSHGAPALYEDISGNLHAVYGSHYSPMLHLRTASPGALDEWVLAEPVDGVGTYPQIVMRPDGDVTIFYRGEARRWWMRTSRGGVEPYGPRQMVLLPDAENAFYAHFTAGRDGRVHAAFVRLDITQTVYEKIALGRHDAYYMYMDADGNWRDPDGSVLVLPVAPSVARDRCMVYESSVIEGEDGGAALETVTEISVREDALSRPCLLFLRGTGVGDGAYNWRFMVFNSTLASGWTSTDIVETDHAYDGGAFAIGPEGKLEAFLNCDPNDPSMMRAQRGGGIGRWTSDDGGLTWESASGPVNPPDPMGRFSAPFIIEDAPASVRLVYSEWTDDWTNFFQRVFLWGAEGNVQRELEPRVLRSAGSDRIETALAVSRQSFPEGAESVVIATANDFPDALAGAPLAYALNGPVLLSPSDGLPVAVAREVVRLAPRRVVLLGGPVALSESVAAAVAAATAPSSAEVERLYGADRYGTMKAVASWLRLISAGSESVLLVSGENWPDALTAGPLAARLGCPVVLTCSRTLHPAARQVLDEWATDACIAVGGPAALSAEVVADIPGVRRIGGNDRYQTAALLGAYALERGLLPYRVVLATGSDFPDALAAAPFAARLQAPVLLVGGSTLSSGTAAYLGAGRGLYELHVVGGPVAVSQELVQVALDEVEDSP